MTGAVRAYVPVAVEELRAAREAGAFGPAPLTGHAVTDALRSALGAGADEEELEYAATTAAADDALRRLRPEDRPARLVAAVDVPPREVEKGGGDGDPSAVTITAAVPWRRLASILADDPADASVTAAVAAARAALAAGATEAETLAERCLDHDLGWYAAQEVDALLGG